MNCPICKMNGKTRVLKQSTNQTYKCCFGHIFILKLNVPGVGGDCKLVCIAPDEYKGKEFPVQCPNESK